MFAIRNLRENHINNQRLIEMLRRQGTISKPMMKQMNKNLTTSSYRYCVPGHKESPENRVPIELFDMSRNETKRYLRSYFAGGEVDLLANMSLSSDSSSENEEEKQAKDNRKKRKPKKEYHKYSSTSSSSASGCGSDDENEDEEVNVSSSPSENRDVHQTAGPSTETKSSPPNDVGYDTEEECSDLMANINVNGRNRPSKNTRTENTFLYENFEKDKQQRRFTE